MESSSDDSFLWTDASNDSINMDVDPVVSHCEEVERGISFEREARYSSLENHYESRNQKSKKKKSKKRKISESSNISQHVKERIKLEPGSDVEARKMKKLGINSFMGSNISQESVSNDDSYLYIQVKDEQTSLLESKVVKSKKKTKHKSSVSDIHSSNHSQSSADLDEKGLRRYLDARVKQEQESLVMPEEKSESKKSKKKKRHKSSNFDIANEIESQVVEEPNSNEMEGYLKMRVKQEEASTMKSKCKKKKKRKISVTRSDTDESASQSATIGNNSSVCVEQTDTEYSVIEDKFSAEETVVDKTNKKRHKRDVGLTESQVFDKSLIPKANKNNDYVPKEYNDGYSDNDISVDTKDFSCFNVVSSTIINNSTMDKITNKQDGVIEDSLGNSKELYRTTKISDRIRFEDDESSSHLELNLSKQSSKVKTFLKANPHLELYTSKTACDPTITVDDEIWILRCPREINYNKLKNINLALEGKCKIKMDSQTYDGHPNEDINKITHVVYRHGQASIMNLPVKGCVYYRKRIPKPHVPEDISMFNNQINFIPLPETKCRHPLFGANYKKAIKLPAVVAARLEAAKSTHNTYGSTKKKKHKKDKKSTMEVKMEDDCNVQSEPLQKKNRKRKHIEDSDAPPKKAKRLKRDLHSADAWESEQAIEENLFNF